MLQYFSSISADAKRDAQISSSSSNPNFETSKQLSHEEYQSTSYQHFKDQKEAFFSKKQLENLGRPE